MKTLYTAAQMRQMDREAMAAPYGLSPTVLMENAGAAVIAKGAAYVGGWNRKRVTILCGKGNNGGDGLVAARHALAAGAQVYVYIWGDETTYSPESREHLQTLRAMADGKTCVLAETPGALPDLEMLRRHIESSQVVVDALVGTGFHGALREPTATVVRLVGKCIRTTASPVVLAVDMPSGVDADTGAVSGDDPETGAITATATITFGAYKRGLFQYPGKICAGEVLRDPIGMPFPVLQRTAGTVTYMVEAADVAARLSLRSPNGHKGMHGTVGIVGGSESMSGAALLAACGAVRSGAGKVCLRVPAKVAPACMGKYTEVMAAGVGTGGHFTEADVQTVCEEARNWSVLALGPGLGRHAETQAFVRQVLQRAALPVVLDADGLYHVQAAQDIFQQRAYPVILTPHLGEFSRLTGCSVAAIQADSVGTVQAFARSRGVYVLLKGTPTYIVSPTGQTVYVNETGNAGMSCGGMGDVLTGIVAAMWVRETHPAPAEAAFMAAYLHGAAGDRCVRTIGSYGYTPEELAKEVPQAIRELERQAADRYREMVPSPHFEGQGGGER